MVARVHHVRHPACLRVIWRHVLILVQVLVQENATDHVNEVAPIHVTPPVLHKMPMAHTPTSITIHTIALHLQADHALTVRVLVLLHVKVDVKPHVIIPVKMIAKVAVKMSVIPDVKAVAIKDVKEIAKVVVPALAKQDVRVVSAPVVLGVTCHVPALVKALA